MLAQKNIFIIFIIFIILFQAPTTLYHAPFSIPSHNDYGRTRTRPSMRLLSKSSRRLCCVSTESNSHTPSQMAHKPYSTNYCPPPGRFQSCRHQHRTRSRSGSQQHSSLLIHYIRGCLYIVLAVYIYINIPYIYLFALISLYYFLIYIYTAKSI